MTRPPDILMARAEARAKDVGARCYGSIQVIDDDEAETTSYVSFYLHDRWWELSDEELWRRTFLHAIAALRAGRERQERKREGVPPVPGRR